MVFLCAQVQSYTSYVWLFWKISIIFKYKALHTMSNSWVVFFNKFELSHSDNVSIICLPDFLVFICFSYHISSSQHQVPSKIGFGGALSFGPAHLKSRFHICLSENGLSYQNFNDSQNFAANSDRTSGSSIYWMF